MTLIPPGYVGVVTNKTDDPRTRAIQGIQDDVLQPGIYFLNPAEKRVDIVSIGYNETSLTVEVLEKGGPSAVERREETAWARPSPRTRRTSPARGSSSPPTTGS